MATQYVDNSEQVVEKEKKNVEKEENNVKCESISIRAQEQVVKHNLEQVENNVVKNDSEENMKMSYSVEVPGASTSASSGHGPNSKKRSYTVILVDEDNSSDDKSQESEYNGRTIQLSMDEMEKYLGPGVKISPLHYLEKFGRKISIFSSSDTKKKLNKFLSSFLQKPIYGPGIILDYYIAMTPKSLEDIVQLTNRYKEEVKKEVPLYYDAMVLSARLSEESRRNLYPISIERQLEICVKEETRIRSYAAKYIRNRQKYDITGDKAPKYIHLFFPEATENSETSTDKSEIYPKVALQPKEQKLIYVSISDAIDVKLVELKLRYQFKVREIANIVINVNNKSEYLIYWEWCDNKDVDYLFEKLPRDLDILKRRKNKALKCEESPSNTEDLAAENELITYDKQTGGFFLIYPYYTYLLANCQRYLECKFFDQFDLELGKYFDPTGVLNDGLKKRLLAVDSVLDISGPVDINSIDEKSVQLSDRVVYYSIKNGVCGCCRKPDVQKTHKKCGRCKKMLYCSVECSKQDWCKHKLSCIAT